MKVREKERELEKERVKGSAMEKEKGTERELDKERAKGSATETEKARGMDLLYRQ